jgi:phosphoglucomutase
MPFSRLVSRSRILDPIERYNTWLKNCRDAEVMDELLAMKDNNRLIRESFGVSLEFGTAGLRGVMGAGTNRMNIYTVRKASQALANFIIQRSGANKGAAIVFDSRRNSKNFAYETALVLCANGIRTYLYRDMHSVPQLSFTIRRLNCFAGVAITASHNPSQYNGYKVYADYGGQLGNEDSENIMREMAITDEFIQVKRMSSLKEAVIRGYLTLLNKELDEAYIAAIKTLLPGIVSKQGSSIRIVYTPLYGTGRKFVPQILKAAGFKNLTIVNQQACSDTEFTSAPSPNPSDPKSMALGIAIARESEADLLLGTDPDADRMGCAIKTPEGYALLTGNQTACLLLYYLLSSRKHINLLPPDSYIVKSIVSTNLANAIAENFSVETREVLTGFRFIAEEIEKKDGVFQFGFEESAGYMTGNFTRDKDGICSCLLMAGLAAECKSKNTTLYQLLYSMYEKYGYYLEATTDIVLEGAEGLDKIRETMKALRQTRRRCIGGYTMTAVRDYLTGKRTVAGKASPLMAQTADVLYFELEGGRWACVRPSGTEPKLKIYAGVREKTQEAANIALNKLKEDLVSMIMIH